MIKLRNPKSAIQKSLIFFDLQVGFTLIEVLIASGILVVAAGAVMRLSQVAIRSEDQALERVRAYHLVQEGFEIVHQIRDTTRLDGVVNSWDTAFPADSSPMVAVWNPLQERYELVAAGNGVDEIVLDGITYRRTLTFSSPPTNLLPLTSEDGTTIPSTDFPKIARVVTVTVSWEHQGQTLEVSGKTMLTDWQWQR